MWLTRGRDMASRIIECARVVLLHVARYLGSGVCFEIHRHEYRFRCKMLTVGCSRHYLGFVA